MQWQFPIIVLLFKHIWNGCHVPFGRTGEIDPASSQWQCVDCRLTVAPQAKLISMEELLGELRVDLTSPAAHSPTGSSGFNVPHHCTELIGCTVGILNLTLSCNHMQSLICSDVCQPESH